MRIRHNSQVQNFCDMHSPQLYRANSPFEFAAAMTLISLWGRGPRRGVNFKGFPTSLYSLAYLHVTRAEPTKPQHSNSHRMASGSRVCINFTCPQALASSRKPSSFRCWPSCSWWGSDSVGDVGEVGDEGDVEVREGRKQRNWFCILLLSLLCCCGMTKLVADAVCATEARVEFLGQGTTRTTFLY